MKIRVYLQNERDLYGTLELVDAQPVLMLNDGRIIDPTSGINGLPAYVHSESFLMGDIFGGDSVLDAMSRATGATDEDRELYARACELQGAMLDAWNGMVETGVETGVIAC